jgi:zinc/manganese transport system permease protein/iron/zinc/copper transport system permease protein
MNNFFELLQIYSWSIPASVVIACSLALIGGQWVARERSAQIFVLGQGASLGIILGLVLNIALDLDWHFLNLVCGFALGFLTLLLSELWISKRSGRTHVYLTLFAFFLALTYLITSLTPALETHMAAAYFGDLAVMSVHGAQISLLTGIIFVIFALKFWRRLSGISFQLMNQSLIHQSKVDFIFSVSTLFLTTLAIQNMGYLFTIGAVFIPTTFASQNSSGLKAYSWKLILISVLGTGVGFSLSLLSTNLPTVPCILLSQIAVGFTTQIFYTKK